MGREEAANPMTPTLQIKTGAKGGGKMPGFSKGHIESIQSPQKKKKKRGKKGPLVITIPPKRKGEGDFFFKERKAPF